jgi:hypothetical protein
VVALGVTAQLETAAEILTGLQALNRILLVNMSLLKELNTILIIELAMMDATLYLACFVQKTRQEFRVAALLSLISFKLLAKTV